MSPAYFSLLFYLMLWQLVALTIACFQINTSGVLRDGWSEVPLPLFAAVSWPLFGGLGWLNAWFCCLLYRLNGAAQKTMFIRINVIGLLSLIVLNYFTPIYPGVCFHLFSDRYSLAWKTLFFGALACSAAVHYFVWNQKSRNCAT